MTTPRTHVDAALQQLGHRLKLTRLWIRSGPHLSPRSRDVTNPFASIRANPTNPKQNLALCYALAPWQAYAANPAHQATRTRSDTV